MYVNNGVKACLLLAVFLLTGCEKNVTFSAKPGDEARYWVYSHTEVTIGDRTSPRLASQSLMHYQIEDVGKTLKMHATPEYFQIATGQGGFTSTDVSPKKRFLPLFTAGFDVTLDGESGELIDIKGRDEKLWQTLAENGSQVLIKSLQQNMHAPGVLQSIPAKKGSVVVLPRFNGLEAELTVHSVTEETLVAIVDAEHAQGKLHGQLVLSRDTGWLKKLTLIKTTPVSIGEREGTSTVYFAMRPENEPSRFFNEIGYYEGDEDDDEERPWFDILPLPENTPLTDTVKAEELFAQEKGIFTSENDGFNFKLLSDLEYTRLLGRVAYRDVTGFDVNGQPLALTFALYSDDHYFDEQMNSVTYAQPLGWSKRAQLRQLSRVTATVDYLPSSITAYSVPWRAGEAQTFQLDGTTVQVTPIADKAGEYLLQHNNGNHQWLKYDLDGLDGQIKQLPMVVGPEWITPTGRHMLAFVGEPEIVTYAIGLKFRKEPTEVAFMVEHQHPIARFSQRVEFVSEAAFESATE